MLLARNFGEADYEALLELDNQPAMARPQLSEAELGRLQTHIHHLKAEVLPKRPPRLLSSSTSSCSDKVLSAQGYNVSDCQGCAPILALRVLPLRVT